MALNPETERDWPCAEADMASTEKSAADKTEYAIFFIMNNF
jgi:hypothetical protein